MSTFPSNQPVIIQVTAWPQMQGNTYMPPQPGSTSVAHGTLVSQPTSRQVPREIYGIKYQSKMARRLGIIQIILGVLGIFFGSLAMALREDFIFVVLPPPIIWVIAGTFGVVSAKRKSMCTIQTCMVTSIIAALTMAVYLPHSMDWILFRSHWYDDDWKAQVAMHSMRFIVGVMELVVSIIASSLSCWRVCCCLNQPDISLVPLQEVSVQTNEQRGDDNAACSDISLELQQNDVQEEHEMAAGQIYEKLNSVEL